MSRRDCSSAVRPVWLAESFPPLPDQAAAYHDDVNWRLVGQTGRDWVWQLSGATSCRGEEAIRLDLRDVQDVPGTDGAFARWLATQAGQLLVKLRNERGFDDPTALRRAGDRESHEFIVAALAEHRPADAVLSEEGKDDPVRLASQRVWIVDPLDGTREFGEPGRTDWAVHIALWGGRPGTDGELLAGAIALPAEDRTLATDHPPAYPSAAAEATVRIAASRTRAPAFVTQIAEEIGAELVPMGSAGAKIAAVINGDVDAYIHGGGQYEWDSAAPIAVARAAGLHTSRLDGSQLIYNRADPLLPDLLVCRADLAASLLSILTRVT
jgi:3'(2'), 5'-bisphosphate nucleotidase